MPHIVILYTPNLEPRADITALCRALADTLLAVHDDAGKQVFPTGGTRVLAYPAAHYAVADGSGDFGFMYLNLRMGRGRSEAVKQAAGQALMATARRQLAAMFEGAPVGLTVQVDEGQEAFDAKHSTLHPLFNKT